LPNSRGSDLHSPEDGRSCRFGTVRVGTSRNVWCRKWSRGLRSATIIPPYLGRPNSPRTLCTEKVHSLEADIVKVFPVLLVGTLCLWLAIRKMDLSGTASVLRGLPLSAVLIYAATMVPTHLFRAWRGSTSCVPSGGVPELPPLDDHLNRGVHGHPGLALPARRIRAPYYVVRGGQSRMSALLGTVAGGAHRGRAGDLHPFLHHVQCWLSGRVASG